MKRFILALTFLLMLGAVVPANAQSPVVQAVLFYSPFCGHCHKVINEDIPPLSAQYNQEVTWVHVPEETQEESGGVPTFVALEGDRLQILFVNTTTPLGSELFGQAIAEFDIPEPAGVPTLIVGDTYMIGSADIPAQFPDLVAAGLEAGGIEWPAISGLAQHLPGLVPIEEQPVEAADPEEEVSEPEAVEQGQADPAEEQPPEESPPVQQPDLLDIDRSELSVRERVLLDPAGNTLAMLILIGMLLSLAGIAARWRSGPGQLGALSLHWALLVLVLVGAGVAAYLSFVESTGAEAVCGPVGDCNTVQQSPYALLFGILPVGIVGLIGYAGLLIAWLLSRFGRPPLAHWAQLAFFAFALLGTLFSLYLTFLEPFVIGAACMWCLSSAVIMTALTILSTDPARAAFQQIRNR